MTALCSFVLKQWNNLMADPSDAEASFNANSQVHAFCLMSKLLPRVGDANGNLDRGTTPTGSGSSGFISPAQK